MLPLTVASLYLGHHVGSLSTSFCEGDDFTRLIKVAFITGMNSAMYLFTLQRSHPSALKRLRVCQRVATVPDVCTSLRLAIDKPRPAPSPLCMACGADGARPAWRSTALSPAAGVRVRLGRAPSGDTGEVRGGAGGLA
jgi:hypothetical protein